MKQMFWPLYTALQRATIATSDPSWSYATYSALSILNKALDLYQGRESFETRESWRDMNDKAKFVSINLDAGQKKAIKKILSDPKAITFLVQGAVEKGYRVSVGPDLKQTCYQAVMFDVDANENKGLLLNSRSNDPLTALVCTLYKASEIKKWGRWADKVDDEGDWMS